MKKIFLIFCAFFMTKFLFAAYSPFLDGAFTDLAISVRDDNGNAVNKASVDIAFQTGPKTGNVKKGVTDETGCFGAAANSIGIVNLWVKKEGFYETHLRIDVSDITKGNVNKTRKWSEEKTPVNVILKKKHKPLKLTLNSGNFLAIPVTNRIVYFDTEAFEWCSPYGNGTHRDIEMLYETWDSSEKWGWFWRKLTMKFPNCVDGFYRAKLDDFSDFPYAYEANTNAVYQKELVLELDRRTGVITKRNFLPDDEYLVFRVRSETNELGQVTKAHYGRIGEKVSNIFGLRMKAWFNPTENDTNLEDARMIK